MIQEQYVEDFLNQVIQDSIDMDWTPRDAAKAIIRELKARGADIVQAIDASGCYTLPDGECVAIRQCMHG